MGVSYNSKIVTNGLVLALDAGNRKSYPGTGTAWTDLSGNGRNGTLTNMDGTNFNSANGGFLTFDGINEYVNFTTYVQPAYATTTSFSWNVWVYPINTAKEQLIMGLRGTDLDFTKLSTTNFEYYPLLMGGLMPINVWQNVCVVKNETNFFYYRNSVLIASNTSSTTKPSKPFYVGGDPLSNEYFNSRIAQVSVYNRALTATEIQQNFNATRSRYSV